MYAQPMDVRKHNKTELGTLPSLHDLFNLNQSDRAASIVDRASDSIKSKLHSSHHLL